MTRRTSGKCLRLKAEFDSQIDLTPENVGDYCAYISGTCFAEGLLHCDRTGVARIVEYGARLVSDQTKLSSRFAQIQDILIESDYWARKGGARLIGDCSRQESTGRENLSAESR